MRTTAEQAYAEFARAEQQRLVRAALLLTGQQQAAEDLVQDTLVRAYVHWRTVSAADSPQAYVRRILTNTYLRDRRRHRETPQADPADRAGADDYARVDAREQLRLALLALPPRQRTAVVLRHYEHLTEAETAGAMGCAVGTVKSLTSRGLARLRAGLAAEREADREHP